MSRQAPRSSFESTKIEAKERNDGDDIHERLPSEFFQVLGGLSRASTFEANLVTWDSPNDPSNPQNWSIKYKWLVTIISTLMALNVYVYLLFSLF